MDIKKFLTKELETALKTKELYLLAFEKLPKWNLRKRKIKGNYYYYCYYREGKNIREIYQGKLSEGKINEYREIIKKRRNYRKLLKELNEKISYLIKALNIKGRL